MASIVFSHGNSFPAGTYTVLLGHLRERGFTVHAVEKFGHDPHLPVTDNWPHLVQQLVEFAGQVAAQGASPVYLVGHSLGGILSLMAAARHPHLAQAVVLLDSPVVGGWRSRMLNLAKSAQLVGALSPGAISQKRRNSWPDAQAVFDHFRHKKAFAHWDTQVLWDYVNHGTAEVNGKRELVFDREVETRIYNTLPDNLGRLLARHPPKCPVCFIGGRDSAEMKQAGMALTHKLTQGRTMMLDGSHLFPMEKPLATAAAIEAALRNLET